MTDTPKRWPIPPKNAALTLNGLAVAMNDALQHLDGTLPERDLAKLTAISEAAEVISCELVHFFTSRGSEDHKTLEDICARYIKEQRK